MAEPSLIYKVAVLRLVERADHPLSNHQLSYFFLDKNYTDYFSAQWAIQENEQAGLLESYEGERNTKYLITDAGKEALSMFIDKLTEGMLLDIDDYLQHHEVALKDESKCMANYYKSSKGGYVVNCYAADEGIKQLELQFIVGSKAQAESMCNNWPDRYLDIYQGLIEGML